MKNIQFIFQLFILLFLINACDEDSIGLKPQGSILSKSVFKESGLAEVYLNKIYNKIPNGWNRGWYMLDSATDDAENSYTWADSNAKFNAANIKSSDSPFNSLWGNSYKQIRRLNSFIAAYNGIKGIKAVTNRLKGEAHFLRGYWYSLLLETYGGIPIISKPQVFDTNNIDKLLVPRNTVEETLDFIVSDFDTAASFFKKAEKKSSTRGSWDAAMAMKGRVLLYHKEYIKSATASKLVLDNTSRTLDANYQDIFTNDDAKEVIFDTQFKDPDKVHYGNLFNAPASTRGESGWGGTCPTQNLVDQYEMKATSLLPAEAGSGYDSKNPYAGRDPRFYISILYDGAVWNNRKMEFFIPGGAENIPNKVQTGYQMRKMLQEGVNIKDNSTQHWIFLRLAEVYLNYAEALIESGNNLSLAVNAINKVRTRAKMPPIALASQSELRKKVRHERRIELAFEEHRFWDIRRWGIAGDPKVLTIYKVDMDKDGKLIGTGKKIWETRDWNSSNMLFPIPQSEMDKNKNLTQNPGY